MSRAPLLGASISGSSAWIIWQILHAPLQQRVRQLECDPHVSGDVVRNLRVTAADLEEGGEAVQGVGGPFSFGSCGFCRTVARRA